MLYQRVHGAVYMRQFSNAYEITELDATSNVLTFPKEIRRANALCIRTKINFINYVLLLKALSVIVSCCITC